MWFILLAPALAQSAPAEQAAIKDSTPEKTRPIHTWTASWYGEKFRGRLTANGEVYNPDELTAAHKTLPFGTLLTVTYPPTGKTVQVRINDRGPFIRGRSIDLSAAAARSIGLTDKGVDKVKVVRASP